VLSRNLTPGVVQSAKDVKKQVDNPAPVSKLKRSYTPLPTHGGEISDKEVSDDSEDSKLAEINKSKKWIATPLAKGRQKRQSTHAAKTKDLKLDDEQLPGIFIEIKYIYSN
jgi:hypothetical protein